MATSIGNLYGTLRLNDKQYADALKKNAARTRSFATETASTFAKVGSAAVVAGLIAASKAALDLGEAMVRLSGQAGLPIKDFAVFEYVARQNQSSGEEFTRTVIALRNELAKANEGSADAQLNFAQLGLDWRKLAELPVKDQVMAVARALYVAGEGTAQFGNAADALGVKNAPKLQAALRQLAQLGFDELAKSAANSGQVLDEQLAIKLEDARQKIENLQRQITVFVGQAIGDLADIASGKIGDMKAFLDLEDALQRLVLVEKDLNEQRAQGGATAASAEAALRRERLAYIRAAAELMDNPFFVRDDRAIIAIEMIREFRREFVETGKVSKKTAEELDAIYAALVERRGKRFQKQVDDAKKAADDEKKLAEDEAAQELEAARLIEEANKKKNLTAQKTALQKDLKEAEKALDDLRKAFQFNAANDPLSALAEGIREANKLLSTGVILSAAYANNLKDAQEAFGSSVLRQVEEAISGTRDQGRGRTADSAQRALDRARKSARQGNVGDAKNQLDYIKSLGLDPGVSLEELIGKQATPDAAALANKNKNKEDTLEGRIDKLVSSIEDIADKLTVS